MITKKIINLMPEKFVNLIFKFKYFHYAKKTHNENREKNQIITIKNIYGKEKNNLHNLLLGMCKGSYKEFYFLPIALIDVSKGYDNYLKLLNSNGRSKIKRASKKGIICKSFNWDNYLDDIYDINTSSKVRQGKIMSSEYLEYPKKIITKNGENFKIEHIGAFYNDKLVGYIELYIYGNFCMTNRLLGHKQYLNLYTMNAMFAFAVQYLEEEKIDYLNYLNMHNLENSSLAQFKSRLGFKEYSLKLLEN